MSTEVELDDLNSNLKDDKVNKPLLPVSSMHRKKKEEKNETMIIALVITFYWVCSMSVVFLNKYIFSYADYEFQFPLFVTW